MKKIIPIIILGVVILILTNNCQSKHEINKPRTHIIDTVYEYISSVHSLKKYNFKSHRIKVNDSIFVDESILCLTDSSKNCPVKFLNQRNNWYLWVDDEWKLFYDFKTEKICDIALKTTNQKIICDYKLSDPKKSFFIFRLKENGKIYSSDDPFFLFHPDFGIVACVNNSVYFRRKDFNDTTYLMQTIKH